MFFCWSDHICLMLNKCVNRKDLEGFEIVHFFTTSKKLKKKKKKQPVYTWSCFLSYQIWFVKMVPFTFDHINKSMLNIYKSDFEILQCKFNCALCKFLSTIVSYTRQLFNNNNYYYYYYYIFLQKHKLHVLFSIEFISYVGYIRLCTSLVFQ